MKTTFSRRELYALGEPIGDSATTKKLGGGRIYGMGGGGGGGRSAPTETTSTSYNTNVPEYARPYVETMLQGTQKQLFQTKQAPSTINPETGQSVPGATEITGFQPYKAYGGTYDENKDSPTYGKQLSYDPSKSIAGFQPMQENAQRGIAGMQMPGEFGQAADVTRAGITSAMGNEYQGGQFSNQFQAPQNYQSGRFAAQQVNAPGLQDYQMGPAQQVGTQDYTGQNVSQYMNPYMQNVVDIQQREAQRQGDIAGTQRAGQAVRSGAFGGSRAGLLDAEAARNLATQKGDIQAQGQNAAFQNAQQQFNQQQQANMQAQMANQGAGLTVGQQNLGARLGIQQLGAGQDLQSQLANQAQGMTAQQMREQSRQFGAGQGMTAAQQRAQYGLSGQQLGEQSRQFGANYGMQNLQAGMQGAQQLAGLGQAGLASQQGIYNLQNTVGAQQQALEQQKVNQSMTDYANAQQYPLMQLGTMSNMLRGLPMQAQTTNQYAAAPNQMTQAIGTAGSAASLYNALKAEGGVIEEKKMASGGITSVPSYDVGGEVYADLMKMGPEELQQQIKTSSSEKVKEMAKTLLKQKQMAGGGIVAFARGDTVEGDDSGYFGSSIKRMDTAEKEFANPAVSQAMTAPVVAPPPAEPAGITQAKPPEPTTGVGTLQATRETIGQDYNKPMAERIAEKQALYKEQGVGAPGAGEQGKREKLMAERANAADEAERTKWMRAAKFFASWGSTPGSTLVAGMAAVRESVPDMINDAKEAKKIRMEMDKTIDGLDEATRLEKKGFVDEAYAEKMKLGEKMQALNIEIAKIQAQESSEDKKTVRGEQHDVRMIAAQKEIEELKSKSSRELKQLEIDAGKFDRSSRDYATNASVYATFTARALAIEQDINQTINKEGGAYQKALIDSKADPTKSANAKQQVETATETLRLMNENFTKIRNDVSNTQNVLQTKLGIPPSKPTMSADDESAYKWAKSNPSDPRSKDILSRLGK